MIKLLKYDVLFLKRTAKMIVFPALIVLMSIVSPLTAKYMNQLLLSILEDTGVNITLPDPVLLDSYIQYMSDLNEIVLLVVLFVSVSIFIRDKTKDLLPLIFSKPVSRVKYLMSKYISFSVLLLVSFIMGYLVFTYYTYYLFDGLYFVEGFIAIMLYFLYLLFLISIAMLMSILFKNYIMAIIMTFLAYIVFSVLSIFENVAILKYFPNLLNNYATTYLSMGEFPEELGITVLLTMVFTGGLLYLSMIIFNNQEIQ
ncbi:MAG: hypothetical protein UMR38_08160 [Candidatus Izemoplasma sp.]|nr:hypothetical protein [Candidatus Izemoplasma sp.]